MDGVHAAGGSAQLAELIDRHGGELYYDLQHYHQIDLADVLRYEVSPRRVLWLVEHLPITSALGGALRGGRDHREWSLDTYLLTGVLNRLGDLFVATLQPHSKKRVQPPKRVEAPQQKRRTARRVVDLSRIPPLP